MYREKNESLKKKGEKKLRVLVPCGGHVCFQAAVCRGSRHFVKQH